jgi:hypothetical protein
MTAALPRRLMTGAWLLLLGYTALWMGVAWDGEWHIDVGPDTFFTAPHLMFYFGTSLVGLTSLAVVLSSARPKNRDPVGPATVRVRGFRVPVAFVVAGLGAAGHLCYGAADLWWHTVYGFDILESTPSHQSLQLAMQLQAVGVIMAFGLFIGRRAARWGLAAAAALCVAAGMILFDGTLLGIDVSMVVAGSVCVWVMGAVAGLTCGGRWVVATGLLFTVLYAATLLFPPFATSVYAAAIGQPFRDGAPRVSVLALTLPVFFPVVAALTAGAVALARRRGVRPPVALMAVGALAAPAVATYYLVLGSDIAHPLVSLVVTAAGGAGMSWFGWQSGALLRAVGNPLAYDMADQVVTA